MGRFLCLCALTAAAGAALSDGASRWDCYGSRAERDAGVGDVVVLAVHQGDAGEVTANGITYEADVDVHGFDRRWFFGPPQEDGSRPFVFEIDAGRQGEYYDSTFLFAEPSLIVHCRSG